MDSKIIEEITNQIFKRLKALEKKDKLYIIGDIDDKELSLWENSYEISNCNEANCYLISSTSLNLMWEIATGACISEYGRNIINALFNNKKVYMLEKGIEYRKYKDSSRKNLFNLFLSYENKVRELGVEIIRDSNLNSIESNITIKEHTEKYCNKVLTENYLIKNNLRSKKFLKISKDCIITPLAQEYIKNNNIIVTRLEGE